MLNSFSFWLPEDDEMATRTYVQDNAIEPAFTQPRGSSVSEGGEKPHSARRYTATAVMAVGCAVGRTTEVRPACYGYSDDDVLHQSQIVDGVTVECPRDPSGGMRNSHRSHGTVELRKCVLWWRWQVSICLVMWVGVGQQSETTRKSIDFLSPFFRWAA